MPRCVPRRRLETVDFRLLVRTLNPRPLPASRRSNGPFRWPPECPWTGRPAPPPAAWASETSGCHYPPRMLAMNGLSSAARRLRSVLTWQETGRAGASMRDGRRPGLPSGAAAGGCAFDAPQSGGRRSRYNLPARFRPTAPAPRFDDVHVDGTTAIPCREGRGRFATPDRWAALATAEAPRLTAA